MVPVPVSASATGEFAALLLKVIFPYAVPLIFGANLIENDTRCPAGIVNGNLRPLRPNSVLLEVAPVTVTLAPLALNEAPRLFAVPTTTLPKFKLAVPRLICDPDVPLAESGIVNVGFGAVERTEICPLTAEVDFGVKTALNV